MKTDTFVKNALVQDSRNKFDRYSENVDFIPEELKHFFQEYNPVDVEVVMNGNIVHFFPVEELQKVQKEYLLGNDSFVFASCNGDPIYLNKNNCICIRCHGLRIELEEEMASSFCSFLELID